MRKAAGDRRVEGGLRLHHAEIVGQRLDTAPQAGPARLDERGSRTGEKRLRDRRRLLWGVSTAEAAPDDPPAALAILLENHRAFLKFLGRRIGDAALAEDILQDAFTKVSPSATRFVTRFAAA